MKPTEKQDLIFSRRNALAFSPLALFSVVSAACGNRVPGFSTPVKAADAEVPSLPDEKKSSSNLKENVKDTGDLNNTSLTFLAMGNSRLNLTEYPSDSKLITKSALYGNSISANQPNTHVLLALQISDAAEGDLVFIFRYEYQNLGSLCAMRKINAGDVNSALMFEGLYLVGTEKLEVILSKKDTCEKKRATLLCSPKNFVNTANTPPQQIDSVLKLRDGGVDSFWRNWPMFNFEAPNSGASPGTLEGSTPAVSYFVPRLTSRWSKIEAYSFDAIINIKEKMPAVPITKIRYANIFGEEIDVTDPRFFLKQNNLIAYFSLNSTTLYRYFISFG